jgi:chromosome segregation ATPase
MEKILEELNTLDSILAHIDTLQKELKEAISNRETVEAERYTLQLKILELQREIKDNQIKKNALDQSLNKAKAVCMRLALEIKRANSKYWNLK